MLSTILTLSCAGPTLATRDYNIYPERRPEIAYQNLQKILGELCQDFQITPDGFHCRQVTGTGHFQWEEIEQVRCLDTAVEITGKYDSFTIWVHGPVWEDHHRQCDDLEEALNIYLKERKK